MNIILLPGNSPKNKPWVTHVANVLREDFKEIVILDYEHWKSGEPSINFEHEQTKLVRAAAHKRPFVIFAKSVGAIVALRASAENLIQPENIIIAGLPLGLIRKQHISVDSWLHHLQIPITIIQNQHDPVGSFDDIITFIRPINNTNIMVIPHAGTTHDYLDIEHIQAVVMAMQSRAT